MRAGSAVVLRIGKVQARFRRGAIAGRDEPDHIHPFFDGVAAETFGAVDQLRSPTPETYALAAAMAGGEVRLTRTRCDFIDSLLDKMVEAGVEVTRHADGMTIKRNGARAVS